ncbi:unnamed protein product [Protopolystoma xenopodis]|uniref:Uncharacterized protein n=1 Tax=Protopolystoma xenopodis TaxID=117903 RepID=A0A448X723_9PLAT|nr:unnamed protein product [Protopolystoma xenopodis]
MVSAIPNTGPVPLNHSDGAPISNAISQEAIRSPVSVGNTSFSLEEDEGFYASTTDGVRTMAGRGRSVGTTPVFLNPPSMICSPSPRIDDPGYASNSNAADPSSVTPALEASGRRSRTLIMNGQCSSASVHPRPTTSTPNYRPVSSTAGPTKSILRHSQDMPLSSHDGTITDYGYTSKLSCSKFLQVALWFFHTFTL